MLSAVAATGVPPAPVLLRVDNVDNPVGTEAVPFFGWRLVDPTPSALQTAYEIRIASAPTRLAAAQPDVWDSGKVETRRQNQIVYAGPPLLPDARYFWQVRVWDAAGQPGPFSAPAIFTVGLVTNGDWTGAAWIRPARVLADDYTYFRKRIELPAKPVERATAYIAGVHKYQFYVNGTLVGAGPAYHYPQYQYYNAWDITALVHPGGANAFAVFNHWFGGGQGRPESMCGVILKAVVHFTDGTSVVMATDGTWKQAPALAWEAEAPVHRRESEGSGYVERIDARQLVPGWNEPGFDDSAWETSTVIGPQPTAPWTGGLAPDLSRFMEIDVAPARITDRGGGNWLVDFGKVLSGAPRITFTGGTTGQRVEMHGGFALTAAGDIDPFHNQGTNLDYTAVLDGHTFVYAPIDHEGFRYLAIEHAPMPLTPENCGFVARCSRMETGLSSFTSPNPTLNGVWELMKHTLTVSAQEQFLDTPTREKGSFLGDGTWQSFAAMPVMGERVLTRRVLGEFIQSMDQFWRAPADRGRMNAVYPNGDGARDIPDNTQNYLNWVWEYYMQTGDRDFLRRHYTHLREIAENVERARSASTGLVTNLPGGDGEYLHGIIDWPPPMRFGYDTATVARTVVNCLAWADFDRMARIAAETGDAADHDTYRVRADGLATAINQHLLNADGVYIDGLRSDGSASPHASQQANILPLALGLVPPLHRAAVIARVKELKMSVGMETVWWLIQALGESDQGEQLVEVFTNESWPGWARCLARGATTTWESWFADQERNTESLSHGWGTIGLRGYTDYLLGVQALKPQFEEVRIRPLDCGQKLLSASGTVTTDRGPITVAWARRNPVYELRVNIPANMTAVVCVPAGANPSNLVRVDGSAQPAEAAGRYLSLRVGAGDHVFERALIP